MTRLEKVFELFINGNKEEAEEKLHEWFVNKAREIHAKLMEEDENLEDETTHEDSEVDLEDKVYSIEKELEELKKEFEELIQKEDRNEDRHDTEGRHEDFEDEENEHEDEEIEDRHDDLEDEDLEDDDLEDEDLEDEDLEDDDLEDEDLEDEDLEDDDLEDEDLEDEDEDRNELKEENEKKYGKDDDLDELEKEVEEALKELDREEEVELDREDLSDVDLNGDDEDFEDLEESQTLSLIKNIDHQNYEGEVGASKAKLDINRKSPIPQRPTTSRHEQATPLNRDDSKVHKGYDLEEPPASKYFYDPKKLANVSKRGSYSLTSVSKEGDKSALLNKIEGGPGNTVSPVPHKNGKKK